MRFRRSASAALFLLLLLPSTGTAGRSRPGDPPHWGRRPAPTPLTWVKIGVFASYAPYDFPRTNEEIHRIVSGIEAEYAGDMRLGDLETDLGILCWVQLRVWEQLGFRIGFHYAGDRTTTMEPEGFGPVRADIRAEASPFNFTYSLVEEIHAGPVLLMVGGGLDRYRWNVTWRFYNVGDNPVAEREWDGRGWGGHALVEATGGVGGLQFLAGASYHSGGFDMKAKAPPTGPLDTAPAGFRETVDHLHFYAGVTFAVF